jgi:adenylate cyclase
MKKILLVDDEPDLESLVLQKFRKRVSSGDIAFLFARDGIEALEQLSKAGDIDLVLADINMPRMDGLSLLGRIQESSDPVATVIVSAYGDMRNIRTAMNRGAFDFLTKPIDFGDFEATIDKTLRHVGSMREARTRRAEAERAHASLARYFSPSLAAVLASDRGAADLSGRRRDVTAMFTDVTGFTALVETLAPTVLSDVLNRYLACMTDVIFEHEGTVAKVMGDGLYILFGAPLDQPDHASRAVQCALALDAAAQEFRQKTAAVGVQFGVTRIGVNSGPALVGDIGGGRFFDYTACGDTINVAARLETANKSLGTRICVSASTTERIPRFCGRPIGDLELRGRSSPLRAFEPLRPGDGDPGRYIAAFDKIIAGTPDALPAFAALVGEGTQDPLAGLHLRRLLNGERGVLLTIP